MSVSSQPQSSWLRKLSVHLWAYWTRLKAEVLLLSQPSKAATFEERKRIVVNFIRTLLEVGAALDQGAPASNPGRLGSIGLYLRSFNLDHIVASTLMLSDEVRAALSQDDLKQVIHFAELSLSYFDAGSSKAFGMPRTSRPRPRLRQRICLQRALRQVTLANAYARLHVGDTSQNLETAFEHYRSAARGLEQEDPALFSLYAADVLTTLGTALLTYPTANRAGYAQQAIEAFAKAKIIAAPWAASIEPPPEVMRNTKVWQQIRLFAKVKYAVPYAMRLTASRWKVIRTGFPDPVMSGMVIPYFVAKVDWHLGIAYRQRGELEKAVEHFDLAVGEYTRNFDDLCAAVNVDKGCVYLEAQSGDQRKNLNLAIESFKAALAVCVENGLVKANLRKTYAQALVGDARAYFGLCSLGEIKLEKYKETFPILTNQLRAAAQIGRVLAMPELLQESLLLLGRAYVLQQDLVKAYRALVLAARVGDRLLRRARTPRLTRYLVGTETALDELLVRVALSARLLTSATSSKGGREVRPVPLHSILCFAERGRTVFLTTHLRSLKMLPKGATDEQELRELFEQRRLWHEAELKLLEQESAPITDTKALISLRERRKVQASSYFAELENVRERFSDPRYDPDRPLLPARYAEIRATVDEFSKRGDTALVEYYFTDRELVAFILLPTKLRCEYTHISRDELQAIKERWQRGYSELLATEDAMNPKQWENGYLLHVLDRLKRAVKIPVKTINKWERETGRRIKRIIIVPHRFLHLIPLHAVQLSEIGRWSDAVSIQYAPSASVLWELLRLHIIREIQSRALPRKEKNEKVVCISYSSPSGKRPLLFNVQEAQAVAEASGGELLIGREATLRRVKDAVRDATYIHFACHGRFRPKAPLEAGLELSAEDRASSSGSENNRVPTEAVSDKDEPGQDRPRKYDYLTVGDIFQGVRLPRARLVVLSACETGLTKVEETHQDYIGLPAGFLYAGATTVISTLWPVSDVANWLLMRCFAQEIAGGTGPAEALRHAQRQLRALSKEVVLEQIAKAALKENDLCRRDQMIAQGERVRQYAEPYPFASPYSWAGFTVNGLGDLPV